MLVFTLSLFLAQLYETGPPSESLMKQLLLEMHPNMSSKGKSSLACRVKDTHKATCGLRQPKIILLAVFDMHIMTSMGLTVISVMGPTLVSGLLHCLAHKLDAVIRATKP